MIENVHKTTETVGTVASSSVLVDGPTPNGQNTPSNTQPSTQSGVNVLSGRSWANVPNVQVTQDVPSPVEEPRPQQDASDVDGQA